MQASMKTIPQREERDEPASKAWILRVVSYDLARGVADVGGSRNHRVCRLVRMDLRHGLALRNIGRQPRPSRDWTFSISRATPERLGGLDGDGARHGAPCEGPLLFRLHRR